MNDLYVFGGDSYTWGEGLELYLDTPFWTEQRTKLSRWIELADIQTPESISFRESNRFPGLVASHFNGISIVDSSNGGGLCDGAHLIDAYIDKSPKAVVYQFTSMLRMTFHFSRFCECNICTTPYGCIPSVLNYYFECLNKKITGEKFTEKDLLFLGKLRELEGIELTDTQLELLNISSNKIVELFHPMFNKHMVYFINNFIRKWTKTTKVLLINSWEYETGELVEQNDYLKNYLVPLKGYDGNYYLSFKKWENTFPHRYIEDEFEGTKNYHSTLLQHRYLADSILEVLEN